MLSAAKPGLLKAACADNRFFHVLTLRGFGCYVLQPWGGSSAWRLVPKLVPEDRDHEPWLLPGCGLSPHHWEPQPPAERHWELGNGNQAMDAFGNIQLSLSLFIRQHTWVLLPLTSSLPEQSKYLS